MSKSANTAVPTESPANTIPVIEKPKRKRLSRPELRARKAAKEAEQAAAARAANMPGEAEREIRTQTSAALSPALASAMTDALGYAPNNPVKPASAEEVLDARDAAVINRIQPKTRSRKAKTAAAVATIVGETAENAATIKEEKPMTTQPPASEAEAPKTRTRKAKTLTPAADGFIPPLPIPAEVERTTKTKAKAQVPDSELLDPPKPKPEKSKDRLNITDVYNALKKLGGKGTAKDIATSAGWEAVRVHGALLALRTHGAVSYADKLATVTGNLPEAPAPKPAGKRGPKPGTKKASKTEAKKDADLLD